MGAHNDAVGMPKVVTLEDCLVICYFMRNFVYLKTNMKVVCTQNHFFRVLVSNIQVIDLPTLILAFVKSKNRQMPLAILY